MMQLQYANVPFKIFALDPAMRYTSIALLNVYPQHGHIAIHQIVDVDNRQCKPHGLLYERIYDAVYTLASEADVFTREGGGCRLNESSKTLFEVAGVTELALWQARKMRFYDIPPMRVKGLVTGDEYATKGQVARALPQYVGEYAYTRDDQSDAVAIGLAFLKLHGIIDLHAVKKRRISMYKI